MLAWVFSSRENAPRVGETLTVDGPLSLVDAELKGHRRLVDALYHARGPVVCRVKLGGRMLSWNDSGTLPRFPTVASELTVIWEIDAEKQLHLFALHCARRSLLALRSRDQACWRALRVKRRWLRGDATDDELRSAESAAQDSAHSRWITTCAEWATVFAMNRTAHVAAKNTLEEMWSILKPKKVQFYERILRRLVKEARRKDDY